VLTRHEERDEIQLASPKPEHPAAAKTTSPFYLLSKPHIRAVLASGFMFSLSNVGINVVFVLYSYTRVNLGGMGRSVIIPFIAPAWFTDNGFFLVTFWTISSEHQPIFAS